MADPATPTPADEIASTAPDYLEDDDGNVLLADDGTPFLQPA